MDRRDLEWSQLLLITESEGDGVNPIWLCIYKGNNFHEDINYNDDHYRISDLGGWVY